jgi:signal transduction histidine kinase
VDTGYANVYGIDITERKQAEEDIKNYRHHLEELVQTRTAELTRANKKLQQEIDERRRLEKEIQEISERERKRLGHELHDSLGQQLAGISLLSKVVEKKLRAKSAKEATDVAEIIELVKQAMDQTRDLARGMHPVDLEEGGLAMSLQELAKRTENLFHIRCTFKYDESCEIDAPLMAVHLYRITQEAITNAVKHGKTKNIQIELVRRREGSVLTVKNDGLDFPKVFTARGPGMGLQIMGHRADIIGASLDIHKAAEGGTIVACSFPDQTR